MATGRARMYFISKERGERQGHGRHGIWTAFGLHGWDSRVRSVPKRSSSQYVLEFLLGCFIVLWIFSIRWAYIRM